MIILDFFKKMFGIKLNDFMVSIRNLYRWEIRLKNNKNNYWYYVGD